MSKRGPDGFLADAPLAKRMRPDDASKQDLLSRLSDELILHILSFLPTQSLSLCQRLSRRFYGLAGDSELWKEKYYARWVWPRARRIRHLKDSGLSTRPAGYTPRPSRWIGHENSSKDLEHADWKKQYRLRHNWSRGSCRVTEVEVAQPFVPPVLVKLCKALVFTADASNGLRAWTTRDTKSCLAQQPLFDTKGEERSGSTPTSIAVAPRDDAEGDFEVTVGFEDGSYSVYFLSCNSTRFDFQFSHPASSNGAITALASSSSYLLTLSQNQTLSLYRFCSKPHPEGQEVQATKSPKLIASLKANNVFAPLSLSIRSLPTEIVASIAYSFSRIGCGWSVGLQELRLNQDGESLGSQLATTVDPQFCAHPFSPLMARVNGKSRSQRAGNSDKNGSVTSSSASPSLSYTLAPTSLSYCHPYLLTSHADNTLTMYLVVSTSNSLTIKAGRRLWGHTSSVSGVQVSDRGKAVSVSSCGGEIRIWELEDMISSHAHSSTRMLQRDDSVQISPENELEDESDSWKRQRRLPHHQKQQRQSMDLELVSEAIERRGDGLGLALEDMSRELKWARMRGWVGFDDEQVVVLHEREAGTQLLGCYDFT
ncbi:hypothetical protein PABG_05370 [Paracoccidioides brasiliensis Pb03]|nr:hypothetical protein PABG_05370 [Paracoccidioides brasiliensis Pb03]